LLCGEFGGTDLTVKLAEFQASPAFQGAPPKEDCGGRVRIAALEEALTASLKRISALETEMS
jgi:hypothetical protein